MEDKPIAWLLWWYDTYYVYCPQCAKEQKYWKGIDENGWSYPIYSDQVTGFDLVCHSGYHTVLTVDEDPFRLVTICRGRESVFDRPGNTGPAPQDIINAF